MSFETQDLGEACCNSALGEARFGTVNAQGLFSMIADVEAFNTAEELIDFLGSKATLDGRDSLLITFAPNYNARLVPVGQRFAKDKEGKISWGTVQRLKLVAIEEHLQ